jgi:hypothetical protein
LVDWVDVSTPTTSGPSAADIGLSLFAALDRDATHDLDVARVFIGRHLVSSRRRVCILICKPP